MPRRREYDETGLIRDAMNAFWSLGYRGTSIETLVAGTGVSRASLYSAYPDKRSLFIESVKRYLEDVVEDHVQHLIEVEPAGEAVRRFFLQLADSPIAKLRRGCMLASAAAEVGTSDRKVAALIRQALQRLEDTLYRRLAEARDAGDLSPHFQPRPYARQLVALIQGLHMMARVGVDRAVLKDAVKAAIAPVTPRRAARSRLHSAAKKRAG